MYVHCPFHSLQVCTVDSNPGAKTIEADILVALVKAGLIMPEAIENPGIQVSFHSCKYLKWIQAFLILKF